MMNYLASVLFLFLPLFSIGQTRKLTDKELDASGPSQLLFVESIAQATALAQDDLAKHTPFLLLQGA